MLSALLIRQIDIVHSLRAPAVSRLQKVYNVQLSLKILQSDGVEIKNLKQTADKVVNGHCGETLSLLWKVGCTDFNVLCLPDCILRCIE